MNSDNFIYWLTGFFELSGAKSLDEKQVQIIKEHMALVVTKVTPTSMESVPAPCIFCHLPPGICNCPSKTVSFVSPDSKGDGSSIISPTVYPILTCSLDPEQAPTMKETTKSPIGFYVHDKKYC